MTTATEIESTLRAALGSDFIESYRGADNRCFIRINRNRIRDICRILLTDFQARLCQLSGMDLGLEGLDLFYSFSLDHGEKGLHVVVKANLPREDPKIDSLTLLTESANFPERETAELLGIQFVDHPNLKHFMLPYEWPAKMESSSRTEIFGEEKSSEVQQGTAWVPLRPSKESMLASVIPIGPYHPALIETAFFKLQVDGEKILNADMKFGFNHRGIMRLMQNRSYWRDIYLAERVCGICSQAHSTAFCRTAEMINKIDIPDRARYIRTFMCELERLQSHLLWLGVAMDLIGFQTLFMLSWKDREIVMDCQEMISGARVHKAMNTIGGARRDIAKEIIPKIETKITELKKSLVTTINTVANDSIIKARTKDVGLLTKKDAINLGVVGPTARASGVDIDVRRDDPYAAYGEVPFKVITRSEGDVLAKVEVRLGEIEEALGICEHCIDVLQNVGGPLSTEVSEFAEGDAFGKVEALRGELVYYISSNGTNVPEAVRMRTPSFNNNASIPYMLREQTIADAPIIIGSIDPCFSCTDRLVELEDVKTHRRYTATLKQLGKKCKRL